MSTTLFDVRQQIERIVDENPQEVVDVIVGFDGSKPLDPSELLLLSNSLKSRRMASSARDILPQRGQLQLSGDDSDKRKLQSIAEYRLKTQQLAAPFLESDLVKAGLARIQNIQKTTDQDKNIVGKPRLFWSSNSVRVSVERDKVARLIGDYPNISHVFPNRRIRKPPTSVPVRLPDPLDENHFTTWGVEGSGALAVWGATGRRGNGVKIGLLDTGIDASHPDLAGKIVNWAEFDDAGNVVPGSVPHDTDQHGTHCAGIMVGGNASGRWIGSAPNAEIAGALVLSGDHATDAQILAGFEWCIETEVDVISMSLGGLTLGIEPPATYTRAALTAVQRGIFIVAAIGNDGSETSTSPGNDVLIMSVGAIDHLGRIAAFSGGRTEAIEESFIFPSAALPMIYSKPDISAPGVAIFSCIPGGQWTSFSGTSMATPHVAAAIALLLSNTNIRETVSGLQRIVLIENLLTGSSNEAGEVGQNHRYGFGMLNVLRAVGNAKQIGYLNEAPRA